MRHVHWDEDKLNEAASHLASIAKRPHRPPPEPKTPYPVPSGGEQPPEMRLSASASDSSCKSSDFEEEEFDEEEKDSPVVDGLEKGSGEEHKEFVKHRREHYQKDGEALHLGRQMLESDSELQ